MVKSSGLFIRNLKFYIMDRMENTTLVDIAIAMMKRIILNGRVVKISEGGLLQFDCSRVTSEFTIVDFINAFTIYLMNSDSGFLIFAPLINGPSDESTDSDAVSTRRALTRKFCFKGSTVEPLSKKIKSILRNADLITVITKIAMDASYTERNLAEVLGI